MLTSVHRSRRAYRNPLPCPSPSSRPSRIALNLLSRNTTPYSSASAGSCVRRGWPEGSGGKKKAPIPMLPSPATMLMDLDPTAESKFTLHDLDSIFFGKPYPS